MTLNKNELNFSNLTPILKGALENYKQSNSNLWASSLCYFSILGFVPILAIVFSIARWLNMDNFLIEKLIQNSPLDSSSLSFLLATVQKLLTSTKNGVLAGFGFFFLGFSVISMFSIIEGAFNSIWQIKSSKNFRKKVGDYFLLFIFFTFIIFLINRIGDINSVILKWNLIKFSIPYIGIWIFFILFYILIPNTQVNPHHATISGLFVSILFNQSNLLLIKLQSVILNYNKIYGSFSIVLIFILWLKIIWFIILIGAHLTFILQNRSLLKNLNLNDELSYSSKFSIILTLCGIFIENFKKNTPPISTKELAEKTNIPEITIEQSLSFLKENNIIVEIFKENDFSDKYFKLSYNYEYLNVGDIKNLFENYGTNFHFNKSEAFRNISLNMPLEELSKHL